jgi:hypothetical protein
VARARLSELEGVAERESRATKVMGTRVAADLSVLPEGARRAILARHPKDPFAQAEAIEFLRESGGLGAVAPVGATTGHAPESTGARDGGSDPDAAFMQQIDVALKSGNSRTRMGAKALLADPHNAARYERARSRVVSKN